MKYWFIYEFEDIWYVWDLRRGDISSLKIKDTIIQSPFIKAILFELEAFSEEAWQDRGMVINTDVSPIDGKLIKIEK